MKELSPLLTALGNGAILSADAMEQAFSAILSGETEPLQVAGLLMGLAARGEAPAEILGAARAMRAKAVTFSAPNALDTCGTGGDGKNSLNISTAAAIVAAGAGAQVAKHGNRAVSSKSGSSDVLSNLGIKLDLSVERARACLDQVGITFLMAPHYHRAVAHVMPVRQALKVRTLFNMLGPLANPAGAGYQLMGVYHHKWLTPMAECLRDLEVRRAWVVHGSDGMDELTVTGPSYGIEVRDGTLVSFDIQPEDFGLSLWQEKDLAGGDAGYNAQAMRDMLAGTPSAYRDATVLNAGAALTINGQADTLADGIAQAQAAIDEGRAMALLERWRAFCQKEGAGA